MRYVVAIAVLMAGAAVGQELPENTNEIKSLTVEQAKGLAQREGELSLNGLTTLSDEAARELAQHEGRLFLDGLTTLSDQAAEALAQHVGWLRLDGVSTLSDKAATALAKHKGLLSLRGLTKLSDEAVATLRANPEISVRLKALVTPRAVALARQGNVPDVRGLQWLESEEEVTKRETISFQATSIGNRVRLLLGEDLVDGTKCVVALLFLDDKLTKVVYGFPAPFKLERYQSLHRHLHGKYQEVDVLERMTRSLRLSPERQTLIMLSIAADYRAWFEDARTFVNMAKSEGDAIEVSYRPNSAEGEKMANEIDRLMDAEARKNAGDKL